MSNFQEIAEELQYRVKSAINLKDNNHLSELVGILREKEWTEDAISGILRNLYETGKVYFKGKAPKGASVQTGPRGGQYYMGNPKTGEPEGVKTKEKKPTKAQKSEEDRISKYDIDNKIDNAKTEQEEMDVVDEVMDGESKNIDDGNYGPGGGPASYGEDRYSQKLLSSFPPKQCQR